MIKRLIAFLLICALALLIGGLFTGPGVESAWYQNANQAPWTPPGWVFGVAWTVIMLFYALYWSLLWPTKENKVNLSLIFGLQIVLNIIWNPIFFYLHLTELALFVLTALFISILVLFISKLKTLKSAALLLLPYLIWLMIAFSLNAYIVWNN